jgi:hypothetical protein
MLAFLVVHLPAQDSVLLLVLASINLEEIQAQVVVSILLNENALSD